MIAHPAEPHMPARRIITEVKYSLPELLEEIKTERATNGFAMEKLDQREIGKLFKARATRAKGKK
jgi:hypothetical protein